MGGAGLGPGQQYDTLNAEGVRHTARAGGGGGLRFSTIPKEGGGGVWYVQNLEWRNGAEKISGSRDDVKEGRTGCQECSTAAGIQPSTVLGQWGGGCVVCTHFHGVGGWGGGGGEPLLGSPPPFEAQSGGSRHTPEKKGVAPTFVPQKDRHIAHIRRSAAHFQATMSLVDYRRSAAHFQATMSLVDY